jgi:hypothetical protein
MPKIGGACTTTSPELKPGGCAEERSVSLSVYTTSALFAGEVQRNSLPFWAASGRLAVYRTAVTAPRANLADLRSYKHATFGHASRLTVGQYRRKVIRK